MIERRLTENDTVHSVGADTEDDHGAISRSSVECRATENETKNSNGLGDCDMPGSLVESS